MKPFSFDFRLTGDILRALPEAYGFDNLVLFIRKTRDSVPYTARLEDKVQRGAYRSQRDLRCAKHWPMAVRL